MMKYISVFILTAALVFPVASMAKDNCENAVDSADSMNVNQQDCDYSNQGLNGALQKAFKKGSEGAVLSTQPEHKAPVKNLAQPAAVLSVSVELDQWASATLARNQLLPKIMEQCAGGFNLLKETYRPLAMGRIELSLGYACLD